MEWQWSTGFAVMVGAAVMTLVLSLLVWHRRAGDEWACLAVALLATAVWAAAYSLELASTTPSARSTWGDLKYLGICALPPAWVLFVLTYTGDRRWRLRPAVTSLLLVEPLLVWALLANSDTHDLIRRYPAGSTVAEVGVLFWPHAAYTYLLCWGATALFVVRLMRLSPVYRRQSVILSVSAAAPFVLNLLYSAEVGPFGEYDLTPFAFLGCGIVLAWGVLRLRLVGLRPLGRNQAFMRISDVILTLDPLGRVVDANAAAALAFGQPVHRLIGRSVAALLPAAQRLLEMPLRENTVEEEIGARRYELRTSPVIGRQSRLVATLLLAQDITERKAVEQQLAYQAMHDALTGTANRTLFFERLNHALDRASRSGQSVAVLYLDLDSFKSINDQLGHAAGDEVLVEVAARLQASLRTDDTVARVGGDEFAILLEDIRAERAPRLVAAHIREALDAPIPVDDHLLLVRASIGIAQGARIAADLLVRQADERMYDQKRSRRRMIDLNADQSSRRRRHNT